MKNYYVISTSVTGNWKNVEFDSLEEATKLANKRQKARKSPVVVLKKICENENERIYQECYNAKGEPLTKVEYVF